MNLKFVQKHIILRLVLFILFLVLFILNVIIIHSLILYIIIPFSSVPGIIVSKYVYFEPSDHTFQGFVNVNTSIINNVEKITIGFPLRSIRIDSINDIANYTIGEKTIIYYDHYRSNSSPSFVLPSDNSEQYSLIICMLFLFLMTSLHLCYSTAIKPLHKHLMLEYQQHKNSIICRERFEQQHKTISSLVNKIDLLFEVKKYLPHDITIL